MYSDEYNWFSLPSYSMAQCSVETEQSDASIPVLTRSNIGLAAGSSHDSRTPDTLIPPTRFDRRGAIAC
jgi:hypothetical protein